jgi:hypothetical protein
MRLLLIGLAIFCAGGCSTVESFNFILPTKCAAAYPPSVGKDLVVGASSDELLRKVGEPNQTIKEKGYTYYVYYLLRGFDQSSYFCASRRH